MWSAEEAVRRAGDEGDEATQRFVSDGDDLLEWSTDNPTLRLEVLRADACNEPLVYGLNRRQQVWIALGVASVAALAVGLALARAARFPDSR
jgi:hypothetical protein